MNINERFYADFIAAGIVYILLLLIWWKDKGKKKIILNTLMYFYVVAVLTVTVMPVIDNLKAVGTFPYRAMRLVPFEDYNCGIAEAIRQLILNAVMFMPFGFLIPFIRKHSLLSVTLLSLQFSVFIEVFQPLISPFRYSDITDVITNTLGGMIGYLCYVLFIRLRDKKEQN